ncbi:MAG: 50S ribosomal protein L20 [Dehalococcoidia bacterium]|nr:50S ribosomal protein L20 [Dehalococcoidia bacterium]
MSRVKRGVVAHRRHKKVLALTQGHRGQRHRLIKRANESMMHALRYNYVDRKDRKGNFRELWIVRVNAAARLQGLSYSRLVHGLKLAGVELDRKALADLAVTRPDAFAQLAEQAKAALAVPAAG